VGSSAARIYSIISISELNIRLSYSINGNRGGHNFEHGMDLSSQAIYKCKIYRYMRAL
jgi:hypothetical protein